MAEETEKKVEAREGQEYEIREADMAFGKNIETLFENLDTTYEGIKENPANLILSNFEKDFLQNERTSSELFTQLNYQLQELDNMFNENHYYNEMLIVRVFKEILIRFKNWATSLRQQAFLSKQKMVEMKKIIDENYFSEGQISELRTQYEQIVSDLKKENEALKVVDTGRGKLCVLFDESYLKKIGAKIGDSVYLKKSSKI